MAAMEKGKSVVQDKEGAAVGSVLSLSSLRSSRHSGSSGSSRHLEGSDFSAEESMDKLGLESVGNLGSEYIIGFKAGGQNCILFGSS